MDTSQRRDECTRGGFLDVLRENCRTTLLPAVTVATAPTSDTSGAVVVCRWTGGQADRSSNASVRQFHFPFSFHAAGGIHLFLCEIFTPCFSVICHLLKTLDFLYSTQPHNANWPTGTGEYIHLKVSKEEEMQNSEFFRGCKDWENISLSTDKYLDSSWFSHAKWGLSDTFSRAPAPG